MKKKKPAIDYFNKSILKTKTILTVILPEWISPIINPH